MYELEGRCLQFAKDVRLFVKSLPKTIANAEDGKQLIRSSGSVGANYIEANESVGKKDFVFRLKIAKKEAKESGYWLKLIDCGSDSAFVQRADALVQEATELMLILASVIRKCE